MEYNLQLFKDDKEKDAIEFIQESIGSDTAFVGFSGGKDSIVAADLVKKSGVKHELFYSFTGIDAPEVIRFIRKNYPECKFLKPKRTFWRDLSVNVPPSDRLRWCCTTLKKKAAWETQHKKRIMGIRSEESNKRAKYNNTNHFKKLGHTHYYPIFDFKEWEIWEYIKKNDLKYPVLYDWGFDRIGCVICPYHSERTGIMHLKYKERWPLFFRRWEDGITELFNKRKGSGKKMYYDTPQDFLNAWYLDCSARWYAKEEKEDKQMELF